MAPFSRENLPAVGTWVTLVQGAKRGSQARKTNAQKTPALVSAVFDECVTVVYPNNFVLMHGFKGEPLKRVPDVPFDRLRSFSRDDVSLQILEKALMTAVKAGASNRPALFRQPATPQRCQSLQVRVESSVPNDRARSRSRSPMREDAPTTPQKPKSQSPSEQTCSRSLQRRETDEKLEATPALLSSPKRVRGAEKDAEEKASPKRRASLTSWVGRSLRVSECGRFNRLPRNELEVMLQSKGFEAAEIAAGLQRLDASNKILLCDGLVFLV